MKLIWQERSDLLVRHELTCIGRSGTPNFYEFKSNFKPNHVLSFHVSDLRLDDFEQINSEGNIEKIKGHYDKQLIVALCEEQLKAKQQ